MSERLTEQAFWEDAHEGRMWTKYLPNPRKYRGHYELDRLFKSVLETGSKKLLELGAGSSIWLPYFAKEFGFEPYGIDYSKKGCEVAEDNLRMAGVKGHIFCGDFFEMGAEWNGFFDVAVSFGVVEHFTDPISIIGLAGRFLKPGGIMVTVVPNTEGMVFGLQKAINRDLFEAHKVFSLRDLSVYHEKAGLELRATGYLQFMDLSILNYDRLFSGGPRKLLLRTITGMNMLFLHLQKLTGLFPQSGRYCSSMAVTAAKGAILSGNTGEK